MNVINLLSSSRITNDVKCDICIIGAGAAGIYLAVRLASHGKDVALVEAGDYTCREDTAVGFEAEFTDHIYSGATKGRAFGVGGTTATWGGLLIPHLTYDLPMSGADNFNTWENIVRRVNEKSDEVLGLLSLKNVDFSKDAQKDLGNAYKILAQAGLDSFSGIHLPFRHKNFAHLLTKKECKDSLLRLYVNAVVSSWNIISAGSSSSRIQSLEAVARNGKKITVTANRYVIAAGTIESTRLLLEIEECYPHKVISGSNSLGVCLSDHLSMKIANVTEPWLERTSQLFAPHFTKGCMRGFRFIDSKAPFGVPKAFSHFIFENEYPAFALAKEVLLSFQRKRLPKITCSQLSKGIAGLFSLAYKRFMKNTLYIPAGTKAHFQLDVEQKPDMNNRIFLGKGKDIYGRRKVSIQWRITDVDMKAIKAAVARIISIWPGGTKGLPELQPLKIDYEAEKPYDAYHPVGTCRMGDDFDAVVDFDLKVRGLRNLWVASTGVLPRVGSANPTFTLLCLTEALSEKLLIEE